jgi:predicted DNA-binding transcriptional regulator YafY
MTKTTDHETGRGRQVKRVLQIIIMLSGRAYTLEEIADRFDVSQKTIRRDIKMIEAVDVPIYQTEAQLDSVKFRKLWRVDPRWVTRRLLPDNQTADVYRRRLQPV